MVLISLGRLWIKTALKTALVVPGLLQLLTGSRRPGFACCSRRRVGRRAPAHTPQFQHWLLGDTPAGAGSGVMMLDSQEVVGFAGLLPRRVEIESDSLLVAHVWTTWCTRKDALGRDPFASC